MANFLGHFNNFITLSLPLSGTLTASPPILIIHAPMRENVQLFL